MEKINLPKSTKNIHYEIFRNTNITDIFVFSFFLGLAAIFGFVIHMPLILKVIVSLATILFGLILIQKINNNLKLYTLFIRALKYIAIGFKKQAIIIQPKISVTEENIFSQKLNKETIFFAGIKLESANLNLLNDLQQENLIGDFSNILRTITLPFKLIKINESYSFDEQIKNFNNLKNKSEKDIEQALIELQVEQLKAINNAKELKVPAVYIIFKSNKAENVKIQLTNLEDGISFNNLKINIIKKEQINNIWKNFAFDEKAFKPLSAKFKTNSNSGFLWSISDLPKQINLFWLQKLFTLSNSNVCININPINKIQAKKTLDNAISKIETNARYYANKTSEKAEAEQYHEAFLNQQQAIIDDVDVLKEISIFIIGYGSKKEITNTKRELKNLANIVGWKYDRLNFLQPQAIIASYFWLNMISKASIIEMTCDTFATSFPFPDIPLNDNKGFLLAETISGKPVVWDLFANTQERINKNLLILGESGSGKSFAAKKILANTVYKDAKVFVLDPEREYLQLAHNLDGEIIDASGSKGNVLNPLHIYKLELDADNADTFQNHLALLEAFFILLFPKLEDDDQLLTLLIQLIKETYKSKNILPSNNFDELKANQFPTFNDLNNLILEKLKNCKTDKEFSHLEDLKSKLMALTQGTYSKYWNGHTKLNWKENNFVCFDLQELVSISNQKIINIQMLLLLRLLSQELIANKSNNEKNKLNKKVVIVVDEAHLLINEKNSFALDFLFHTVKRIRKYNGSLVIITQNINDFTGTEEIKKKFTGIINNTQYWMIGGMQPNDLTALNDMYKESGGLSDAVKSFIATAKKGKFLFKVSKQEQLPVNVLQLPIEFDLVEKAASIDPLN